jgi:hypothetical protein
VFNTPADTRRYNRQAYAMVFVATERWALVPGNLRLRLLLTCEDFNLLPEAVQLRLVTMNSETTGQLMANPHFQRGSKEMKDAMMAQFEEIQKKRAERAGQLQSHGHTWATTTKA